MIKNIFFPFYWIFQLYKDGFTTMSKQSKTLWIIGVLKLAIMFGILKMFFFKDFLKTKFHTEEQRIEYVQKELTKIKK